MKMSLGLGKECLRQNEPRSWRLRVSPAVPIELLPSYPFEPHTWFIFMGKCRKDGLLENVWGTASFCCIPKQGSPHSRLTPRDSVHLSCWILSILRMGKFWVLFVCLISELCKVPFCIYKHSTNDGWLNLHVTEGLSAGLPPLMWVRPLCGGGQGGACLCSLANSSQLARPRPFFSPDKVMEELKKLRPGSSRCGIGG